jgi:hypothetical protein
MRDKLDAIKMRAEYAPSAEPGRGQDDLFWLIAEVDRLRGELAKTSTTKAASVRRATPMPAHS